MMQAEAVIGFGAKLRVRKREELCPACQASPDSDCWGMKDCLCVLPVEPVSKADIGGGPSPVAAADVHAIHQPTNDIQRLDAAAGGIVAAKTHLAAVRYDNGSYQSIKFNIDGARDLLLQAEMNIESAAKKLASPIAQLPEPETE